METYVDIISKCSYAGQGSLNHVFRVEHVFSRFTQNCQGGCCNTIWIGSKESALCKSRSFAMGFEMGWKFVTLVKVASMTVIGFIKYTTSQYLRNCPTTRPFMDLKTFIKWWFVWTSCMKILPNLAVDGTQVGFLKSHVDVDLRISPKHPSPSNPTPEAWQVASLMKLTTGHT